MPFHARTPKSVVREIVERRKRGEPRKAIAIDMGLTETTVTKFVAHLPEDEPGKREERRAAIVAMLEAGCDISEILERTGCKPSHVVRIVRAATEEARAFAPDVPPPVQDKEERNRLARERYHAKRAAMGLKARKPLSEAERSARAKAYHAKWHAARRDAERDALIATCRRHVPSFDGEGCSMKELRMRARVGEEIFAALTKEASA